MDKKTLLKFCAPVSWAKPSMEQPFSRGKYTYATNGNILIRVPRMESVPESPLAPDVDTMIGAWFHRLAGTYVEVEKREKMSSAYLQVARMIPLPIFGTREMTYFDNNYLALISSLPSPTINVQPHPGPSWFTFVGGDGLIMPMRP